MTRLSNDVVHTQVPSGGAIAEWFENFDRPQEPAVIVVPDGPPDDATELECARQEGWNEGFIAACRGAFDCAMRQEDRGVAQLFDQAKALDQRLESVIDRNALAIAQWLVEALATIIPGMLRDNAETRILAVAAILRSTIRSVTHFEVQNDRDVPLTCRSAEDAWR